MSRNVSLTLQNTGDSRSIVEAIMADNATAQVREFPSMTKIDCPDRLVIRAGSVTSRIGRPWDVQEIHLSVISLSGTVDEEEDEFTLFWK
jgi:phenol hydroxylase P2 protein